jgi:hypothetical protein
MADLVLGSTTAVTESSGTLTYVQAGGLKSMQVFETAGTFPNGWVKPSGINTIKVYVTGAGGGAISNASANKLSGAGGGTAIEIIDVRSITSVDLTVGAGSTGETYGGGNSVARGGTSSFGSHCSATGGMGAYQWDGSEGGEGSGGDINLRGQGGNIMGSLDDCAISGGNSFWGGGGRGRESGGDSVWEEGRQGGGAGASDQENTNNAGPGIIVVEEYS